MAKRNRSAVYVDFVAVQAELFFDGQILRGESFVDFDQIDVIEIKSSFLQGELGCWHRAAAHHFRFDPGDAPAYDSSQRLQSAFARFFKRHNDDCGGAIYDTAGISRSNGAALAECGLQFG